jgi:two-component system, OmpR family, sensor histidine kinase KdpD
MEWQPVEEVVGSTLEILRGQLAQHAVDVAIDPTLPPLRFDAVLVERVLCNLVENAIKYSPAGSTIRIAVRSVGAQFAEFSVCDEGRGLPAGEGGVDAPALFDMFVRGDAESAIPGTGVGLSIARAIVEAHAGHIWAEQHEPRGACLRFTLPLTPLPDMHLEDAEEATRG